MVHKTDSTPVSVCLLILRNPRGKRELEFADLASGEEADILLNRMNKRQLNELMKAGGLSDQPSKWLDRLAQAYVRRCMEKVRNRHLLRKLKEDGNQEKAEEFQGQGSSW